MKMYAAFLAAILAVVVLVDPAAGQVKSLPERIEIQPGVPKRLTLELSGDDVDFADSVGFYAARLHSNDPKQVKLLIVPLAVKGGYTLSCFTATSKDNKGVISRQDTLVVIGGDPTPPTPTPPGPGPAPGPTPPIPPGPTPPGPTPPPPDPPAPIAGDGLKVLIVFEKKEQQKLTPGQINAIWGEEMYSYMKAKSGEILVADKDENVDHIHARWKDALARPRRTMPWIIVSNGKTGTEQELPKSAAEIIALIKKYGGN